ncbi:NADPH2:quinone reductase [Salsuginibacillus halophilus]|uniref:NADPH2:quinone reductase n=1 Tax=Salsuginibacillus halophilus TaxID=517424 RepID=A0A2P8HBL2_9BACI|nr:NADPH:quinone oxidoreductase family protein [Salsuginibacillus halophilus]PSL43615.1 NADPH2:quinone reductase [Salsuginibacillus halophilus]
MKAVQFTEYGGPEVLKVQEFDAPVPEAKQVVIQIEAIGVNYADTMRREGQYVVDTPLPFIPGAEVAGVVESTGSDVTRFSAGDRVVALVGEGGYAEKVTVDEAGLIPVPEGVDAVHAAAIPLQGLSAYHILKTMGRIAPGETVLVHAAAGGVGLFAVQMAKLMGAGKVIGTAGSEEKRELARSFGADVVIDYTKDGWAEEVKEAAGKGRVDLALEMAGGSIFHDTLRTLAPFGRLVIYGVASGEPAEFSPMSLMEKNKSVIGFFLPQIMRYPELLQKSLEEMLGWIQTGEIKLHIGGVYDLQEAPDVHRKLEGRETAGKLILTP